MRTGFRQGSFMEEAIFELESLEEWPITCLDQPGWGRKAGDQSGWIPGGVEGPLIPGWGVCP